MKKLLFILAGLIILSAFSFCEDDEVITWSKERKLTWNDYKGKPKRRFAAASTVYSLGRKVFEAQGKVQARVEAYFYCKDSWKKEDWISQSVLDHEQKHFDIVELYARRIRKQMSQITFTSIKNAEEKLDSLYQIENAAMDKYQDKYDNETDGSMDGDAQRKWQKQIDDEITALDAYKSTIIFLKLK